MEQTPLTPEQQEYLNDYQEWLDKRPEKVAVPYIFHAQLVLLISDDVSINVRAGYANDINYVKPKTAELIIMSMAKNLTQSFKKAIAENAKN
jgi:hypothetical protein